MRACSCVPDTPPQPQNPISDDSLPESVPNSIVEHTEQAPVNADQEVPGSSEQEIQETSGEQEQPHLISQDPVAPPSSESGIDSLTTDMMVTENSVLDDGQAALEAVDQEGQVAGSPSAADDGQAVPEAGGETGQVSASSPSKPPRLLEPLQGPSSPQAPPPLPADQPTESQVQQTARWAQHSVECGCARH